MCTLILGFNVVAPQSMLLGANRDEDPSRPSEVPAPLGESPPIVGGRDLLAGGTWLAIRGRETAVAMLNRRGQPPAAPTRSRGLLTLDVAREPDPALAFERLVRECYAPFTLVVARPRHSWILAWDGERARLTEPGPGWHVLTHTELDDDAEPRAAWLKKSLEGFRPESREEAEKGVVARLARHDDPAVCLHEGPMKTVSSAVVWLAGGEARFVHAEGRPCVTRFEDFSQLLREIPQEAQSP